MKTDKINFKNFTLFILIFLLIANTSCNKQTSKKTLVFKDYPKIKLGFSTQNFLKSMPFNVEGLTEIIEYASNEGFQFIEIRDFNASLSNDDCRALAGIAKKNKLDVIYAFNKNPLDSGYIKVFERGLANALVFPGPGILRTSASKSELDTDTSKKGWTKDELIILSSLSDSCALIAKAKNIQFIVENGNEAFFGDSLTYFGLTDFFSNTSITGLQLDIANLFRNTSRVKNDPGKVLKYISTMGNRWVETHLKTILGGEPQPVLTDNPMPIEKVIALMGQQNILYCAIELNAVSNKQECFDNHAKSIQFLKDKGVLKK